ncbi:hypothetical protein C8R45DRAFT_941718 [Mycena sanguinolenta]|nr:hypothetical protein C8R45DRAFT_941718 [Mycena sanguinolenta]
MPYSQAKRLQAFEEYLEAVGASSVNDLPYGSGRPPVEEELMVGSMMSHFWTFKAAQAQALKEGLAWPGLGLSPGFYSPHLNSDSASDFTGAPLLFLPASNFLHKYSLIRSLVYLNMAEITEAFPHFSISFELVLFGPNSLLLGCFTLFLSYSITEITTGNIRDNDPITSSPYSLPAVNFILKYTRQMDYFAGIVSNPPSGLAWPGLNGPGLAGLRASGWALDITIFDSLNISGASLSPRFEAFNAQHSGLKRRSKGIFSCHIPGIDNKLISSSTIRLFTDYNEALVMGEGIPPIIPMYYSDFAQNMNRHDDSGFGWAYVDDNTGLIIFDDKLTPADAASFCVLDSEINERHLAADEVAVSRTYFDNAERLAREEVRLPETRHRDTVFNSDTPQNIRHTLLISQEPDTFLCHSFVLTSASRSRSSG